MNRKLKVRAWDGVNKQMVIVRRMDFDKAGNITVVHTATYSWYAEVRKSFKELTLMEYSGLKAKNGVEIYEGDIVRGGWADHLQPQVVVYQAPEFVMKTRIKGDGIRLSKSWARFSLSYDQHQLQIVLGNIYENPELLEVR